jgi:hypothetical protein
LNYEKLKIKAMKTKLFFFFLLALPLFILFGCEKDVLLESQVQAPTPETRDNNCNPHDVFGELHNQGMDYVLQFEDEMQDAAGAEYEYLTLVVAQTEAFLTTVGYGAEASGDVELGPDDFSGIDLLDYQTLLDQTYLTSYEQAFLMDYFYQIPNYNFESADDLDAFIAFTEEQECIVSGDPELVNHTEVFASLSIGKNSAQYWHDYSNNDDTMNPARKIKWWKVIAGDLTGAVVVLVNDDGDPGTRNRRLVIGGIVGSLLSLLHEVINE